MKKLLLALAMVVSMQNSTIAQTYDRLTDDELMKTVLLAQSTTNITGWAKAQFGMTPEQVTNEYQSAVIQDEDGLRKSKEACINNKKTHPVKCQSLVVYELNDYYIGKYQYDVVFAFYNNRLEKVFLFHELDRNDEDRAMFFLRRGLQDRYGKPSNIDPLNNGQRFMYTWITPTGRVRVIHTISVQIYVEYEETEQDL